MGYVDKVFEVLIYVSLVVDGIMQKSSIALRGLLLCSFIDFTKFMNFN